VARLSNNATKAERLEVHQAKMAGKRFNRENGIFRGESPRPRSLNMLNRLTSFRSIAQGNRNTGKPHEHAREIMRRTMSPLQRRAFAAAVAANLEVKLAA
jgi:hypothetical protein